MNELISVIVLNYNGRQYLENCFNSIRKQTYSPLELIMVDNNSTDGSVEYVREKIPDVKIIQNSRNYGFAEGNNIGVLKASGKLVAILNNDTIVNKNWLEELYNSIKKPDVAVVGSTVYTQGVNPEYYRKNGTLNLLGYSIYNVFERPTEAFIASGCSLLFDKEKIGLPFDPDYFFYSEDVYLSWLTQLRGYGITQSPASIVHHIGSVSAIKQKTIIRTFYQERNRLLNLLIFYEFKTLIKILPLLFFDFIFRPINIVFNPQKSIFGQFKMIGWFLAHPLTVLRKRKKIQSQRKIADRNILQNMSCFIFNDKNIFSRFINTLSCLYCFVVGIKTIEIKRFLQRTRVWEIDVAMRYYPVAKFLKSFYNSGTKILEVGSGGAGITAFFPVPIVAVDIKFENNSDDTKKLITKIVANVENLPFPYGYFDVAISVDMFEHLSEKSRKIALKEFFRIIKTDGKIILVVPCGWISSIHEKLLNAIYKLIKKKEHPWLKEHIVYGLPQWKELYKQIKLVNSKCEIQVIDNVNVFMWFWIYIFRSILPYTIRWLLMKIIFPIVKNINFIPYRKIFIITKK